MRILVIFTCAVSFIAATPVVFPDIDNNGYFAVEQVILDPDSIPVGDLLAQAAENAENVADAKDAAKPSNDLSILAPIAFILKPTTEVSHVATEEDTAKLPLESADQASSVASSPTVTPEVSSSSTSSLLLISTSTPRASDGSSPPAEPSSSPLTTSPATASSSKAPPPKAPCKEHSSEEGSCEEIHKITITEDQEEDLKEKAAEVEAEPVILTPSVKK